MGELTAAVSQHSVSESGLGFVRMVQSSVFMNLGESKMGAPWSTPCEHGGPQRDTVSELYQGFYREHTFIQL